jgi:hypothetical protein
LFLSDATATTGRDGAQFQKATLELLDGLFARVRAVDEVLREIRLSGSARHNPK